MAFFRLLTDTRPYTPWEEADLMTKAGRGELNPEPVKFQALHSQALENQALDYKGQEVRNQEAPLLGAFVINLETSPQRFDQTQDWVSQVGLPLHRIPAFDGAHLPLQDPALVNHRLYGQVFGRCMGPGTLGCALSHYKAWQTFLTSSYQFGLICEDDMDVPCPIRLARALNSLILGADSWDVCGLHLNHRGAPRVLARLTEDLVLCAYRLPVTGGGCYLLTRLAAQKLLAKALPVGLPVDHYFTRGWEFGLRFVGVQANHQDPEKLWIERHQESLNQGTQKVGKRRGKEAGGKLFLKAAGPDRLVYPRLDVGSEIGRRGRSHLPAQGTSLVLRIKKGITLVATACGFFLSALRLGGFGATPYTQRHPQPPAT